MEKKYYFIEIESFLEFINNLFLFIKPTFENRQEFLENNKPPILNTNGFILDKINEIGKYIEEEQEYYFLKKEIFGEGIFQVQHYGEKNLLIIFGEEYKELTQDILNNFYFLRNKEKFKFTLSENVSINIPEKLENFINSCKDISSFKEYIKNLEEKKENNNNINLFVPANDNCPPRD